MICIYSMLFFYPLQYFILFLLHFHFISVDFIYTNKFIILGYLTKILFYTKTLCIVKYLKKTCTLLTVDIINFPCFAIYLNKTSSFNQGLGLSISVNFPVPVRSGEIIFSSQSSDCDISSEYSV